MILRVDFDGVEMYYAKLKKLGYLKKISSTYPAKNSGKSILFIVTKHGCFKRVVEEMAGWKTPIKALDSYFIKLFLQMCVFCPLKVVRIRHVIHGFANTGALFQNSLSRSLFHTQLQAYLFFLLLYLL